MLIFKLIKMRKVNFLKAMEIITGFHTTELIVNKPKDGFVGDITQGKPTIHLKTANAGCIEALQKQNFTLFLENGLLRVDDFKIVN